MNFLHPSEPTSKRKVTDLISNNFYSTSSSKYESNHFSNVALCTMHYVLCTMYYVLCSTIQFNLMFTAPAHVRAALTLTEPVSFYFGLLVSEAQS